MKNLYKVLLPKPQLIESLEDRKNKSIFVKNNFERLKHLSRLQIDKLLERLAEGEVQ